MKKSKARFYEPSLVPLADMLTNTVGIMVFILIFTVLTAGGAVIVKRLPMEHSSETTPLTFLCAHGRVLRLNADAVADEFLKPLGQPKSYEDVELWLAKFNARHIDTEDYEVAGEGAADYSEAFMRKSASLDLAIALKPKEAAGESVQQIQSEAARFRHELQQIQPAKWFAHFVVYPDSVDVFLKARQIASDLHFGYGWMPAKPGEPVLVGLTAGGGYRPRPQ